MYETLKFVRPEEALSGVLVLTCDKAVAETSARIFGALGAPVITVDSATAALEHLAGSSFDIVFGDLDLRGSSGIDALSTVHAYAPDVPLVLLGDSPTTPSTEGVRTLGLLEYIQKPASDVRLSRALARARDMRARSVSKQLPTMAPRRRRSLVAFARCRSTAFDDALDNLFVDLEPVVDLGWRAPLGFEARIGSRVPDLQTHAALFERADEIGRTSELIARSWQVIARAFLQAPADALLFVEVSPTDLLSESLVSSHSPLSRFRDRTVLTLSSVVDVTDALAARVEVLRVEGYLFALREATDHNEGDLTSNAFVVLGPEFLQMSPTNVRGISMRPERLDCIARLLARCNERGTMAIAQGVDSAEEQAILRSLGCALVQGPLVRRHALRSSLAPSVARRTLETSEQRYRARMFRRGARV